MDPHLVLKVREASADVGDIALMEKSAATASLRKVLLVALASSRIRLVQLRFLEERMRAFPRVRAS